MPRFPLRFALILLAAAGCAGGRASRPGPPLARPVPVVPPPDATATAAEPALPPPLAYLAGLMPLRSTGVDRFLAAHPTYDGRGTLIAILDSGVDPAVPGLVLTSTGAPKLLDARDFSGEGRVALEPTAHDGDTVRVPGGALRGARRIARLAVGPVWYAGVLRERALGGPPAADLNGNGTNTDVFPVVVVRAPDGWAAFFDSNLNGSFEDEAPLHDYRQGRETIALGRRPLTLAANFGEVAGAPELDLHFDTSGHGTHVAGIAAGHDLFQVAGYHGVAPGAQLISLKIANNARGGVSVHGSMLRALRFAARFAAGRRLALVANLSFGVGNEAEGGAAIDSLVNEFLDEHPDVLLIVSAGNDGPGLSTLGFPGSADRALSVGAVFPGAFAQAPEPNRVPAPDVLGWWSARGGEVNKPDLVAPGVAFSVLPPWATGGEVKAGTSMAAPYLAGLAACLWSAMLQEGRRVQAVDVARALVASARPLAGGTRLDQGAGVPRLDPAYAWLAAGHQGSAYLVRATTGRAAAFRRGGLAGPGDTLETFRVRHAAGLRAARFALRSDAPWLRTPPEVVADPRVTEIPLTYDASALAEPGVYVGTVTARNPSDTLAGPLFTLVNTVVVPYDLRARPLADEPRTVAAGRLRRYFLRAGPAGSTLRVEVSLADADRAQATLRLYEPTGQPFRDAEERSLGGTHGERATLTVRGDDLVPGVYELDVVAPPLAPVTATVRAQLSALALTAGPDGLEAFNPGGATAAGRVRTSLVGAQHDVTVTGRGAPAESLWVAVPAWASAAEVDVAVTRDQWHQLTDFAVTVYDSTGAQLSQKAHDYAFGRQRFAVAASRRGQRVLVELFPGYAWTDRTPPWRAEVAVRFLLDQPREEAGGEVSVVAGGRQRVAPPPAGQLAVPEGFLPLVEVEVGGARAGDRGAVRRVVAPLAPEPR